MLKKNWCRKIWRKCRNPVIYRSVFLLVILLCVLNAILLNIYSTKIKANLKGDIHNGFLINTLGCRIPFIDPYDKLISSYLYKVEPFKCSTKPPLVTSNTTTLYLDYEKLSYYNVTHYERLNCCYQPFWRVNPTSNVQDNLYGYGKCIKFHSNIKIKDEYVKIICQVNNTEIYTDFHSFVPIKNNSMKNLSNHKTTKKPNVLIVGLDSVSRSNFQRQLPRTNKFLREKLDAIELIGYNKVGDNTFPNLIPVLTGLSVEELQQNCWNTTETKFDDCAFIWKNFSKAGYLTAFAEDSSWMGLFNYLKRGFKQQPTDYYWKTFNYLAEKEIGHLKPYNAHLCIGPRPVYAVLLDYILKFEKNLKDLPHFGLFWGTSLSHDDLNYLAQGDDTYVSFFEDLCRLQVLNNTVLIFLSDHGMRWGEIRTTYQGHLEERLPFIHFILPNWFSTLYPTAVANLRLNSNQLTTPFDLHETLIDILNVDRLTSDQIKYRSLTETSKRGISLFLSIPDNRTCSSAGIAAHWCTCQKSIEVHKNSIIVSRGAEFIVDKINKLLTGYNKCSKLSLGTVTDARLMKSDDYLKNNSTIHDYTITIKTEPGNALFEATLRCTTCQEANPFQLTGTISRLNLYGNQSSCITNYQLKLYCYCIH